MENTPIPFWSHTQETPPNGLAKREPSVSQNQVIPVSQASIWISAARVLLLESLSRSSSDSHHRPGTSSPEKASVYSSPRASPGQPSPPRSGPSPEQQQRGRLSDSSTRTDPGPYQHWTLLGPGSPRLQDTEQELSASSDSSYRWLSGEARGTSETGLPASPVTSGIVQHGSVRRFSDRSMTLSQL